MTSPNSNPTAAALRSTLQDLEAAHATAGTALLDAQARHTNAIRHALSTGDYGAADATKTVLDAQSATHQQIATTLEIARRMLVEAVQSEKAQAEASARAEIATRLAEIDTMAEAVDAKFDALVADILEMSEAEYAAHDVARSALRSLASSLTRIADSYARGDEPRLGEAPVSKTAREVRSNLEGVFSY
ncbi:hypothetical protein MHZ93_24280 [Roseomonas sp. ACRSG]|nr:hypothetical protein [Roseomonas sp. ACRSG]